MSVTKETVAYIANLARLSLSDSGIVKMQSDMNKILEYMDLLNQVDTSNIEPMEHVYEPGTPLRADIPGEPLSHDAALKNAPDADSDYFRVPKVIE